MAANGLKVDFQTMVTIRVMEFDKRIAATELIVADLKAQRSAFIHDSNVQLLQERQKQPTARVAPTEAGSEKNDKET
jgi:hypothetical protein